MATPSLILLINGSGVDPDPTLGYNITLLSAPVPATGDDLVFYQYSVTVANPGINASVGKLVPAWNSNVTPGELLVGGMGVGEGQSVYHISPHLQNTQVEQGFRFMGVVPDADFSMMFLDTWWNIGFCNGDNGDNENNSEPLQVLIGTSLNDGTSRFKTASVSTSSGSDIPSNNGLILLDISQLFRYIWAFTTSSDGTLNVSWIDRDTWATTGYSKGLPWETASCTSDFANLTSAPAVVLDPVRYVVYVIANVSVPGVSNGWKVWTIGVDNSGLPRKNAQGLIFSFDPPYQGQDSLITPAAVIGGEYLWIFLHGSDNMLHLGQVLLPRPPPSVSVSVSVSASASASESTPAVELTFQDHGLVRVSSNAAAAVGASDETTEAVRVQDVNPVMLHPGPAGGIGAIIVPTVFPVPAWPSPVPKHA